MANRDAAERACKDPNPIIDGRKANVNLAYLGAKPRGMLSCWNLCAIIRNNMLKYPYDVSQWEFDILTNGKLYF